MRSISRITGKIAAISVTLMALIPLLGLVVGLFNPPLNPFTPHSPNFWQLLQQPGTWRLFFTTVALAAIVSCLAGAAGIWLAWVEQRKNYYGGKWLALLDLLPLAMPSYLLAATLREAMGPGGLIGEPLGLPIFIGFWPAVFVITLTVIPYVQLLVSAALARTSVAEEEAARSLGASARRVFWQVIFPTLRPSFAFAWLISLLYTLSDFGAVSILDTQVLTWRLYQAVEHQQLAKATQLGFLLLLITIPVFFIAQWLQGHSPQKPSVANVRAAARIPMSLPYLLLTYGLHILIIGFGVIIPVLMLGTWLYNGWSNAIPFASLWMPIRDTLQISLPSAALIVIFTFLPARVVIRQGHRWFGHLLEQGLYFGKSLPGILLAFGLILTAMLIARPFEQGATIYHWLLTSGLLLFLGYAMRFLPEAYAGVKGALLACDPRHTEIARTLTTKHSLIWRKIYLPAMLPSTTAAFLLVWLAIVKELPVTLLLAGAMGLRPLSFRIFDRYQEAFLHDVAAAGIVLLLFSFALVCLTLRWRRHVS